MNGGQRDELYAMLEGMFTDPDTPPLEPERRPRRPQRASASNTDPVVVRVGDNGPLNKSLDMKVVVPVGVSALLGLIGFLSTYVFVTKDDLQTQRQAIIDEMRSSQDAQDKRIGHLEREIARRGEWMKHVKKSLDQSGRRIEEILDIVKDKKRRRN